MTTESKFEDWILNFLSKPNPVFNDLPPCPFAKESWLKGRVLIRELNEIDTLSITDYFLSELENYSYHWPKDKEVVALVCDPSIINSQQLVDVTETAAKKFLLNRGFVALEDHPDLLEEVNNVVLNNGSYAIIFLQPLEKLNKARKILKSKGYYKNWTNEYYLDVINF